MIDYQKLNKHEKIIFALIIGIGIISFWRGIWALSDNLLFQGEPVKSAVTSIIIGMAILILTGSFVKKFLK